MVAEVSGAALGGDEPTELAERVDEMHAEQPPELANELKKLQSDIETHAVQLLNDTQTQYNNFFNMSTDLDRCVPPPPAAPSGP